MIKFWMSLSQADPYGNMNNPLNVKNMIPPLGGFQIEHYYYVIGFEMCEWTSLYNNVPNFTLQGFRI